MAATKTFSIEESLRFGWEVLQKNFGLILQFIFATLVLYFAQYLFGRVVGPNSGLAKISEWLVGGVVGLGWMWAALTFQGGKKPRLEDLQKALSPVFLNYLLASLLYALLVVVGLILLIIPGFYFAIKHGLFGYLIVDKKVDALTALKMSGKVTEGAIWPLFGFFFAAGLINALGALAFGVGLVVTLPVTILAGAQIYRSLLSQTKL
ncbi:MAG: hypothetical protein WEC39_00995 [Patescibacteria group bacterium]